MSVPTTTASQQTALISSLDSQRAHVLGILDGLTDDQLRQPMLPSGWSCLELLNHLTWDDERFWFRAVIAGEPEAIEAVLTEGGGWQLPEGLSTENVFAAYRRQVELANDIARSRQLSDPPAWWPPFFDEYRLHTVGEVLLHMLSEVACHAGHLDAARELIDGRQWFTFDE